MIRGERFSSTHRTDRNVLATGRENREGASNDDASNAEGDVPDNAAIASAPSAINRATWSRRAVIVSRPDARRSVVTRADSARCDHRGPVPLSATVAAGGPNWE